MNEYTMAQPNQKVDFAMAQQQPMASPFPQDMVAQKNIDAIVSTVSTSNKVLADAVFSLNNVKCAPNSLYDPFLNKCITCRDPNFTPIDMSSSQMKGISQDVNITNSISNNTASIMMKNIDRGALSYMCINDPIVSRDPLGNPLTFTCDTGETFNPPNTNISYNRLDDSQFSTQFSSAKCSILFNGRSLSQLKNMSVVNELVQEKNISRPMSLENQVSQVVTSKFKEQPNEMTYVP